MTPTFVEALGWRFIAILVLLAFTAPPGVIYLKRTIQRVVAHRLGRRLYDQKQGRKEAAVSLDQDGLGSSQLVAVAAVAVFLAQLFGAFDNVDFSGHSPSAGVIVAVFVALGVWAFLATLAAVYLHYAHDKRRSLKYDLALSSFLCGGIGFQLNQMMDAGLRAHSPTTVDLFFDDLAVVMCGLFLVGQWFIPRLVKRLDRAGLTRLFQWCHRPVFWFAGAIALPLLGVLLQFRYYLVSAGSISRILYLRSFHHPDSIGVFSRIVVKCACRYGLIVGLVHRRQRMSDLHHNLEIMEQGHFTVVPDDRWQDWVNNALRSCSLAIVDGTLASDSVLWELESAVAMVGADRVALLLPCDLEIDGFSDVWRCRYSLDSAGVASARSDLRAWLEQVLLSSERPQRLQTVTGDGTEATSLH